MLDSISKWFCVPNLSFVNIDEVKSINCPGLNCIRGLVQLKCDTQSDRSILGSYSWQIWKPGLQDVFNTGGKNIPPGVTSLAKDAGDLATSAFSTCQEAKEAISTKFMNAIENAAAKVSLNQPDGAGNQLTFFFPKKEIGTLESGISCDSLNYIHVGITIAAIFLCSWGAWKCYQLARKQAPIKVE